MNLHPRRWMALLLLGLLAVGCGQAAQSTPTADLPIITLTITPAALPVVPAVNACAATLPDFQFEIEEGYPSQASGDLLIRLGVPQGNPGFLAQIAEDELAVVLHPDNPATSLTSADVQALFSGQVTNWAEYSGSDAPVQVWVPLAVDETRTEFDSHILEGLPVVSGAGLAPDPAIMQQIIAADPNAIGYLPAAWQSTGLPTILLGIRLPVLVAASQQPAGPAAELIACLQGEPGQQAVQEIYP